MDIQTLIQQLQGMGLLGKSANFGDLSDITPGQISGGLGSLYGVGGLESGMFSPFSKQLLNLAKPGAYTPMIESEGASILDELSSLLSGGAATKAAGGFAGGSGFKQFQSGAKDVYGQGMQNTLTQAVGAKTQSIGTIQDIINQWQQTAQSFTPQV